MAVAYKGIGSSTGTASVFQVGTPNGYIPSVGDLFVLSLKTVSESATATVTDSHGNTWTLIDDYVEATGVGRLSTWYAVNGSAGSVSVTVILSASSAYHAQVIGYSGTHLTAPLFSSDYDDGSSNSPSGGAVVINAAGDLVVSHYLSGSTSGGSGNQPSSPFVRRILSGSGDLRYQYADDLSAPGNEECTFSIYPHTATWAAMTVCFKQAVPVSPPPAPPPVFRSSRLPGPPVRGMPWTAVVPTPRRYLQAVVPVPPAPPSPPVPVPPPPPPGTPPVPPVPPLPPAPQADDVRSIVSVNVDEQIDPPTRRALQKLSGIINSLGGTYQLVQTGADDYSVVVTTEGFTGSVGDP